MRSLWLLLAALTLVGTPALAAPKSGSEPRAGAKPKSGAKPTKKNAPRDVPWCTAEVESLADDLCYIDGRGGKNGDRTSDRKRTLVVFLHGMIAKHTDWSWTQEKALLRQAKASGFEAIFPRAPERDGAYAWPGGAEGQKKHEAEILAGWKRAQKQLETRSGARFDHVFVMGFSSGAYYVSTLALRGRLQVDGYATFAGGSIGHQPGPPPRKVPVYVGICGDDKQTAQHSRGFAGELATRGFVVRAEEHKVGHMFADPHVAHAVAFLRAQSADKPAIPVLSD